MASKRKAKQPKEEFTQLSLTVKAHEAHVSAGVNPAVYSPEYALSLDDDEPVFQYNAELLIVASATFPKKPCQRRL